MSRTRTLAAVSVAFDLILRPNLCNRGTQLQVNLSSVDYLVINLFSNSDTTYKPPGTAVQRYYTVLHSVSSVGFTVLRILVVETAQVPSGTLRSAVGVQRSYSVRGRIWTQQ